MSDTKILKHDLPGNTGYGTREGCREDKNIHLHHPLAFINHISVHHSIRSSWQFNQAALVCSLLYAWGNRGIEKSLDASPKTWDQDSKPGAWILDSVSYQDVTIW